MTCSTQNEEKEKFSSRFGVVVEPHCYCTHLLDPSKPGRKGRPGSTTKEIIAIKIMKIALVSAAAAVVTATSASAFVPSASFARSASSLRSSVAVVDGDGSATVTSDDDIYEKIGFAKGQCCAGH